MTFIQFVYKFLFVTIKNLNEVNKRMKRTHIAVPDVTAKQVRKLKTKMSNETGVWHTSGAVVAKCVKEVYDREIGEEITADED